ncbi:bli-3-like protein 2 [Teratosphaeria destructans]|uniref:Bli-3-like protein 2 n=1 Tax=Teratosphaeria destructans TaxID=418781 RepID=A0A9W7W0J9_9PEZI|nr:bli-3-like protein 2 [Teratosphaeria destructans]
MPEPLKPEEVKSQTDPSVAKQYDESAPLDKKLEDFYAIADKIKISMLGTYRNGIGPVSRCMAVAKRSGPDFLFLANAHSRKFVDLEKNGEAQVIFHNNSSQDWISVSGIATTSSSDPRIREIYSSGVKAWFGDLKDGVHDGGPSDPRMKLIEVKAKYISYYKSESGMLGAAKEIIGANLTGGVANTGVLREIKGNELDQARAKDSALTS